MKRFGVLTSGGDAPGMNAAIRAVVRTGLHLGCEVLGVRHGYQGLIDGDMDVLGPRDVGGILDKGGTVLGSARCPEFKTDEGRTRGLENLRRRGVEGLVIIGGNGSQQGSYALSRLGVPVVGVASTIDNDLYGSDITIGVDTALNIALEAIDRLRTTASSHQRAFLVEVMGRDCGYLGLMAALAGGAEAVVLPEAPLAPHEVAERIRAAYERGKTHCIVVVAEGAPHDAAAIARHVEEHADQLGFALRVTILGHVQRGGKPGAFDRLLAARLGSGAAKRLVAGESGVLVGLRDGRVATTPLAEVVAKQKPLDAEMLELTRVLAR